MAKLEDRVFFVTGATSGIGEFTAELLAKELGGWRFRCCPSSMRRKSRFMAEIKPSEVVL